MAEDNFLIPLEDEITKFRCHLDDNNRIIFSAKFGDGKTTFLKEFCNHPNQKDCFFITLHPINYSVAKNEDIFEYIKRDILLKLNEEGYLEELDLDAIFSGILTWDVIEPALSFILAAIPNGKLIEKIINIGKKAKEDYDKRKETFGKYEDSFVNQRGGIYENDGYTQLIKAGINYIQTKSGEERKVVLIIEDLDRLDPAHLFRILNILGAHLDIDKDTNKFDFDKIIAVLDYNTTKNIFEHFYGTDADFEGYMSKFFSHYRYEYSITKVAQNYLRNFLLEKTQLGDRIFNISTYSNGQYNFTIGTQIDKLSVRRIVQILDNFECSFTLQKITINNQGDVLLFAPIMYILSFIVRLNCIYYKSQIIQSLQQQDILIPALGSFLCIDNAIANGMSFHYNRTKATLSLSRNGNLLTAKLFSSRDPEPYELQYNTIESAFNIACNSVKDFLPS